jgi:hypothetical protein
MSRRPVARPTCIKPQIKRALAVLFDGLFAVGDCGAKTRDLSADGGAEGGKSADDCDRNQRCGNSVFRQLKTGFIAKEIPNHLFAPLVWLVLDTSLTVPLGKGLRVCP